MATSTTQLTIDLAAIIVGRGEPDDLAKARPRAGATFPCVLGFMVGCAAGAVLELHFGVWGRVLPVVLAVLAVPMGDLRTDSRPTAHEQGQAALYKVGPAGPDTED